MSYEGYEQCICENGHYYTGPDQYNCASKCPYCKAGPAWSNSVDDTNCDVYGIIPDELLKPFMISEMVVEICSLGHPHVMKQAIYRCPTAEETKNMRHYRDRDAAENVDGLVPISKTQQGA